MEWWFFSIWAKKIAFSANLVISLVDQKTYVMTQGDDTVMEMEICENGTVIYFPTGWKGTSGVSSKVVRLLWINFCLIRESICTSAGK